MNRIEKIRDYVDSVLLQMTDAAERRGAYVHLYGVSQACTLIAQKRNHNVELAAIAGMLHDIYTYSMMDPKDHAHKGAVMARDILTSLQCFTDQEINLICSAVYNHGDKDEEHSAFDEVLVDADVLQHCLYNPLEDAAEHEKQRFEHLKSEFGLR